MRAAPPELSAYAASKSAVDTLTRILAKELRGRDANGQRCGAGPTATPVFLATTPAQEQKELAALPPLERLGSSDDIEPCRGVLPGRAEWPVGQRPGGLCQRRIRLTMGTDHYDVLVVGSGPGGATTAARVAEKPGKRVLLLERGDFLPRERDNWNSRAVFGAGKYMADETFYDLHDRPFRPELHYFVGGNSKVYGAALLRLLPADFGEVQHPNGVAPAWPLSYADMEPYYVRAEHLFWVHGQHGEDPFVSCLQPGLRIPAPVRHEPAYPAGNGRTGGAWPASVPPAARQCNSPRMLMVLPTRDSLCIRCDRIDGFPCPVGAKADAESAVLRPALAAHPNLVLMTRTSRVERLLTRHRRQVGVTGSIGHAPRRFSAYFSLPT